MASRPILFSGPMARAILDGRKTQTRRIVKHIPALGGPNHWCPRVDEAPGSEWLQHVGDYRRFCPYGAPGDELWVRETWGVIGGDDSAPPRDLDPARVAVCYRVDDCIIDHVAATRWRPSIHMPRWASRITLRITDVRVERLQSISEADARAEGVEAMVSLDPPDYITPQQGFRELWESINGEGSWATNPWLWVVSFERRTP